MFVRKSISEFNMLPKEQQVQYLEEKEAFEAELAVKTAQDIEELKSKNKELLEALEASKDIQLKQGTEITKLKEKKSKPLTKKSFLMSILEAKKDDLAKMYDEKKGTINLVLDTKATQTYGDIDAGEDFAQFRAGIIDQPVRDTTFRQLFVNTPLSTQFLKYTEQDSVDRNAQNVANCSPVTSTTKETLKVSLIEPVKVKDTITACIDFLNDFAFMEARIRRLLGQSVSLKVDQQIMYGSGIAPQTNSIDSVSSEFDPANVECDLSASIQAPNLVDLIRGMATQIYELGKQNAYIPNVAIVNNCDWFKMVESLKDLDNNYLMNNTVVINGQMYVTSLSGLIRVVTSPIVVQNTCYVMDTTKGEIIDRQQFTIDIAFQNGVEWESDLVSMKGAERLNFLVPNEWANAFMKCSDVATALTAITKV